MGELASKAAVGCMKTLLLAFNFIFWITGIAILALGIWMKVQLYMYMELTTEYYPAAPFILIGIGAGIVIIGSLGCCCTVKGHAILLYVFSFFLVLVFIAELAVGISAFILKGKLQDGFQEGLSKAYTSYSDKDDKSRKAIDTLQSGLGCCGMNEVSDWFATPWGKAKGGKSVPKSCCKNKASCPNDNVKKPYEGLYDTGCYTKVTTFLEKNFSIIGGVVIGIAFSMLFGALLACCLAKNLRHANYEKVA